MIKKLLIIVTLMCFAQNLLSMETRSNTYTGQDRTSQQLRSILLSDNRELSSLKMLILSDALERIIRNNSLYTPLKGVKEFLNTVVLVDKECHDIVIFLGWNNAIHGSKEPRFVSMVKCWFVPRDIIDKDQDSLNVSFLNELELIAQLKESLFWFTSNALSNDPQKVAMIKNNPHFFQDQIDKLNASSRIVAQFLIAGANPNVTLSDGQMFIFLLVGTDLIPVFSILSKLIPLALQKKVSLHCYDNFKNTPLICVAYHPDLLKMLLEYDDTSIHYINETNNQSALIKATTEDSDDLILSVELLLQHGADPDEVLATVLTRYNPEDSDLKAEDYEFSDTDMRNVELAFGYGADLRALPDDVSINPEILQKLLAVIELRASSEPCYSLIRLDN